MDNSFTLHYAQSVKQFRKQKGISQIYLELEAGLALGTISRIESGKINPTKETLIKIIRVLNLEKDEILRLFMV